MKSDALTYAAAILSHVTALMSEWRTPLAGATSEEVRLAIPRRCCLITGRLDRLFGVIQGVDMRRRLDGNASKSIA